MAWQSWHVGACVLSVDWLLLGVSVAGGVALAVGAGVLVGVALWLVCV